MTDRKLLNFMIRPTPSILYGFDNQLQSFFIFFGISFICHLCIFGLIAFAGFADFSRRPIMEPTPITVDLVSLNPEIPLPPSGLRTTHQRSSEPLIQPQTKTAKKPLVTKEETVPLKQARQKNINPLQFVVKPHARSRVKKSLKKKSLNTAKLVASAVKRIAQQTKTAHPKTIEERINQLKKEVEDRRPSLPGNRGTGKPGASYPKGFSQIEVYQAEVSVRLKNNWVFSEELAGNTKGLEARLVIKILPDGTITDVWYEKRSGNSYLDDSAYKTVMKSNPLPPLPEGYPYYHLVLGFTPSGVHQ